MLRPGLVLLPLLLLAVCASAPARVEDGCDLWLAANFGQANW